MKKTIMLFAMLLVAVVAMAAPVSQQVARQVAQTWMQAQGMKNVAALQDITAQTPFTEFYVFAAPEGGFILVSGDDCVQPVLGYSVKNRFVAEGMPQHVLGFLQGYEREIRWWKEHSRRDLPTGVSQMSAPGEAGRELPAVWRALLDGAAAPKTLTTSVAPLLTTTWDQSPYYNNMCPSNSNGQAVTGCVATATAQVMKYHNHPAQGYGSHSYISQRVVDGVTYAYGTLTANFGNTTYQWSLMPNALSASSSTSQVNAVAKLMYHIGVADEMAYSPVASGAQNYYGSEINRFGASSQESLARYFKYRPDMAAVDRDFYSHDRYVEILRGELDQQRPILYSGSDVSAGHSFVIDGYNTSGYFHVNWGWGSWYDDYYAIGGLEPAGGGTGANMGSYNLDNIALIGIRPNTAWSTSGTTTVTASMQSGSPSGSSVSVYNRTTGNTASSYAFGDTVVMLVSMPEGYRFDGWSDGCSFNVREILATGGNYSFTAQAAPIASGDIVSYTSGAMMTATSYPGGVKFPASVLDPSKQLTAIHFYAYSACTYNFTVYTGANHNTVAATVSHTVTSANAEAWNTVTLPTPVAATEDVWIMVSSNDQGVWPLALSTYSGVPGSLILTEDMYEYGGYWGMSAMIKAEFTGETVTNGDTVSYCGNNTPENTGVGTSSGMALEWGIMLPAGSMQGNYLKSVMLYVLNNYTGAYTLKVYRGGDTVPGTLAHTQTVVFNDEGWQEAQLDAVFALNNQNLWITFSTTGMAYPMSVCAYTGSPNSDWVSLNGGGWNHITGYGLNYSWLIKAVTSQTPPSSFPPPSIAIDGQELLGTGMPYTFTAAATDGANVTWTLQGATPATATGTTVTATWNTPGNYMIVATATNSYGTDRDTLLVQVVDYTAGDTISYVSGREHYTNVGTGQSSAFGWGIMVPPAFIGNRTQITGVQAGLAEIGTYTLTVYQGGDDAPQTQIATYTFSTTAADTASGYYFTYTLPAPLAINNASNLWVVLGSTNLAYPAGTVAHVGDPNSDWTQWNGNWYHLPQLGLNGSWEIKILTGASTPQTQYTITANSNNSSWGTVTGGGTYNSGATVTLTAMANTGYHFVQWQDGNTQNPRTITVTGNATYTATFEADQTPQPMGDTVSYCGNNTPDGSGVGTSSGMALEWGIMLPANMMTNNYLKSVMLYVLDGFTGAYTLNIYRGGDTVPGTLAHSQVVNFTSSGWQEAQLDAVFALNSQNLWITFSTTGMTYPMSVCDYTGSPNSDWVSLNGSEWNHITSYGLNYSWLIRAVTSQTPPSSFPPPVITISGQERLGTGMPYTFTATATDGATISWTLNGATPATANGATATATWSTQGNYYVIATATNSYGTGRDTMLVEVIDYTLGDTLSYIHGDMHYTNVGTGQASAFSWGIMMPPAFIGNRTQVTGVQAVLAEIGTYTLTIYQGGSDAPQTQIATYTFSTTAADTARGHYFTYTLPTPLAINNASNLWVVLGSTDLEYPAGTVYHVGDPNSDWTQLNGNWYHLPQLGINGSWAIKILTNAGSTPQPTQYTITANSNNSAWGTVTGGGTYNAGSTATLTAVPASGYHFVCWNDEDTVNPRYITVTGDAYYIATFASNVGIEDVEATAVSVMPNPATDMVTVSGIKTGTVVTLVDINGRALMSNKLTDSDSQTLTMDVSALTSGVYFVHINDGAATAVHKLIVK